MTFCYTHRKVPSSVIIREIFSYSRCQLIQRHTARLYADIESPLSEHSLLHGMFPSSPSTQVSGNPTQEEMERVWEPEGLEDTEKARPINQHEQNTHELRETSETSTGCAWVCTRPFVSRLWIPAQCFSGFPECANEWAFGSCAWSWALFLLLVCFVKLIVLDFVIPYYILLYYILLLSFISLLLS